MLHLQCSFFYIIILNIPLRRHPYISGFNKSSQGKKHKSLAEKFIEVTTRIKKEGEISSSSFEPAEGFGPPTPRLQITCSTAELRRQASVLRVQRYNFFLIFFIFLIMAFYNVVKFSCHVFK